MKLRLIRIEHIIHPVCFQYKPHAYSYFAPYIGKGLYPVVDYNRLMKVKRNIYVNSKIQLTFYVTPNIKLNTKRLIFPSYY